MPINLKKTVNFGSSKSGLSTVGYRLHDSDGTLSGSRVAGSTVGEVFSGSGIYSGSVHIADGFIGSILWDTGESTPTYASDDIDNVIHTLNMISSSVDFTRHITAGRWHITSSGNDKHMVFYKEDNSTEVIRFNLTDEDGSATVSSVFQRTKV